MAKGAQFERDFCRQLSLWWSDNKHEDLFWRTSQSGGRATVRHRKGKTTRGQYGDISATSSLGRKFTRVITLELKRGYPGVTLHSLIDLPKKAKAQQLQEWFEQARKSNVQAGGRAWMVVHRRDRKEALVYIQKGFWMLLFGRDNKIRPCPFVEARLPMIGGYTESIVCTTLDNFFRVVPPSRIKEIT